MIDTMLRAEGPSLAWLGNAGWLVAAKGRLIATDLDLHLPERALPAFDALPQLARALSCLIITHAHTDHFNPDTVRYLMANGPCRLILPESCRAAATLYGLDPARLDYVRPAEVIRDEQNNPVRWPEFRYASGEWADLSMPWLRLRPMHALHGHLHGTVYAGAHPADCGYLMELEGLRLYQPGDSVLLEEQMELRDIDVLFVSPTEHNMAVTPAARWIEAVRPRQVFAQHFGTYHIDDDNAMWTRGYTRELAEALSDDMRGRYTIPEYGRVYPLSR